MTGEMGALFAMLLITLATGVLVIKALCRTPVLPAVSLAALAFPVGAGTVALILMVLGMMHVPLIFPLGATAVLFVQVILLVLLAMRGRTKTPGPIVPPTPLPTPMPFWQKILGLCFAAYLIYETCFIVHIALVVPFCSFDDIAVYGLKSKVFFYDASIAALKDLPVPSYPLLVPLEMLWVNLNVGYWHDTWPKIVFPVTYASFMAFFYVFVRERTGTFWALAASTVLVSSNFFNYHATIAYQDFTMMAFNVLPQMLILMSVRRKDAGLLPLAGMCAALGVFTKFEGFIYFAVNTALCLMCLKEMGLSRSSKIKSLARFMLPSVIVYLGHAWFVASQGFPAYEGRLTGLGRLDILGSVSRMLLAYADVFFIYNNWTVVWAVLICSLWAAGRRVFKDFEIRFWMCAVLVPFAVFSLMDIVMHNYISQAFALSRAVLHIYPAAVLAIIFIHEQYLINPKKVVSSDV